MMNLDEIATESTEEKEVFDVMAQDNESAEMQAMIDYENSIQCQIVRIGDMLHNITCSMHGNEDLQQQLGMMVSRLWSVKVNPEESKALDAMDQVDSEEWNGEGLPPVGAMFTTDPDFDVEFLCNYSSNYVVVGEMLNVPNKIKGMEVVIDFMKQKERTFRKPETPQQRE